MGWFEIYFELGPVPVTIGGKQKKSLAALFSFGAERETRTPTGLRPHEPESCASTNSATSAGCYREGSLSMSKIIIKGIERQYLDEGFR